MERSMYYVFAFILFSVTLTIATAAQFLQVQNSMNAKCKYRGKFYNVGDEWQGDGCLGVICSRGSMPNEVLLTYSSCGEASYPPNCRKVYDNTLKYPECCKPNVHCRSAVEPAYRLEHFN